MEKGKNEQIASETHFDAIHDFLNKDLVKEEFTEMIPFSKYWNEQNPSGNQFGAAHILKEEIMEEDSMFNERLQTNVTERFPEHPSRLEVMRKNSIEDPKESKFSPTDSVENTDFNGLIGELAKPKTNHFDNGVIIKNEYEVHSDCTEDSSANSTELKTETFKTEYDIDIIYKDVKPQICEEKSSGKNESYLNYVTDKLIGTEIRPNLSCELSKDSKICPQHSIEEDGTTVNVKRIILQGHIAEHENIHTGKKPFQCQICSKSFSRKEHLMVHERIHTGEKPFWCKVCPKNFTDKSTLLRHERIHEKPFQCKVCPKTFAVKRRWLLHEKIHTGEILFQCTICFKNFTDKSTLLRHEIIHTGEKPFQCKICSKSFSSKGHVMEHEKIHTGEKPFKCAVCPKSFAVKRRLLLHQKIHTGENLFQCNICSKNFTDKSTLLRHERIHTGEKLFQCEICLKQLSSKGHLMEHERIHTGEKPFKCIVCSKSFAVKRKLLSHERIHTEEKPLQCKVSPKSFALKYSVDSCENSYRG